MRLTNITHHDLKENELRLYFQGGAIGGISFAEDDILRIRFNSGDTLLEDCDRMVVEAVPAPRPFRCVQEEGGLRLETGRATVIIRFFPAHILAYAADGRLVFSTKESAFGECEEHRSVLRISLGRDEEIHGLGQDPMGNVNQNGHERRMWNEWGGLHVAANAALPFYFSGAGYAFLLNSGWPSRFAVGAAQVSDPPPAHSIARSKGPWEWGVNSGEEDPDDLSLILEDGRMDGFVILRTGDEAIRAYGELTGRAPLPPKWILGYMQSRNRYRTSEEFLALGRHFRETGIPCDTVVVDWLWFRQFGDMAWDTTYWKNPKEMIDELHRMGFHFMMAFHPFIYEDCLTYEDFRAKGYLMNTPPQTLPIFDHSSPEAREAWWQATKKLVAQGVDAYWIDMGEPRDHPQGTTCHIGSREHVHNLYSSFWSKGLYDGHTRDLDTRPFMLSRTSYAGIQRYGAALWSNDIDSSWEVLKDQVPVGIGVCASGLPYWCTDIGGFATDERYSPELFIRWLEWGVFCPLMRTHGTRAENEPWSYGDQAGPIIEKYIRLRYQLMPYLYACARQIYDASRPMMRGLFLDFPDDPVACAQRHEYMFGPALLVAPILDRDARRRQVYLPRGVWFDYWTGRRMEGGREITVQAPLDRIPLFVREGNLLPMTEAMQYVGEKPEDEIIVHVYGDHGSCMLYDDAGEGHGYEHGEYAKTMLTWENGRLTATLLEGKPECIPQGRRYTVVQHEYREEAAPLSGLSFDWDQTTDHVTRIHVTGDTGLKQVTLAYELTVPVGLSLTDAPCYFRKTPLSKGRKQVRGVVDFTFELTPDRSSLPALHTSELALTCLCGGEETNRREKITFGYGYVNEVQMLGFLEPRNPADADLMRRIEQGEYADSYALASSDAVSATQTRDDGELSSGGGGSAAGQERIYWNLCKNTTCFGYLDMRAFASKRMIGGRGMGYARFVVCSDRERDCFFEFSADRSFTLWVNGEMVYSREGMLLKQIPDKALHLNQGENIFLVRCFVDYPEQRSGREIGFSLRLVNAQGQTLDDLLFHA